MCGSLYGGQLGLEEAAQTKNEMSAPACLSETLDSGDGRYVTVRQARFVPGIMTL